MTEADEKKQTGVEVQLSDCDGNAFAIIGKACKAMRKAGIKPEVIEAYQKEAMSGDHDNVIQTTMKYCEVS